MQRHYLTFRLLVILKEKGITRRINFLISHNNDNEQRRNPTKEMLDAQLFFEDSGNKARMEKVLMLMEDDKSRETLKACVEYRANRIPIPNNLCSEDDQYFVEDIIRIKDGEVFIDGGAYTGDTTQQLMDFAKKHRVKQPRIVAFEPDSANFDILSSFYGKRSNIKIYQKGLADQTTTLLFKENGVTARIVEDENEATNRIDVIDIDSHIDCQDATFIKMDIEGAEWDALHGARNVILNNKPKLAICIYHSNQDMIRLAEYIHELVPEYKLYVRHHSKSDVETVIYAVM